jgi:hypothetical protein
MIHLHASKLPALSAKSQLTFSSRVLISQNHSEIYVTIAEYDKSYPGYLYKKIAFEQAGFLKMHRFGPFEIQSKSNMEKLGGLLRVLLEYATTFEPPSPTPSPPSKPADIGQGPARPATPDRGQSQHGLPTSRSTTPVRQMQQLSLTGGPSSRDSSQSRPPLPSQAPAGQAGISQATTGPGPGPDTTHGGSGQGRGRGRGRGQGRGRGRGA